MKAIVKAKIKALDYYTMKEIVLNKAFTADGLNFNDKTLPARFGLPELELTAIQQADSWLHDQSAMLQNIIDDPKQELHCILDWQIISISNIADDKQKTTITANKVAVFTEKQKFDLITTELGKLMSEDIKNDFLAAYAKMKDSIKGLSAEKKIKIIFDSMSIGYKAATEAYNRIGNVVAGNKEPETKQLKNS